MRRFLTSTGFTWPPILAVLVCFQINVHRLHAQGPTYIGLRVSLFDVEILQNKSQTVLLKCRIANTGRLESGINKNASQTIIELDTFNLPSLLWGHESLVSTAAINNIPRLKPGEISSQLWLSIRVKEPSVVVDEASTSCPDLIVDTAYVFQYSDEEITLRYEMRNNGNIPVEIAGKTQSVGVNVYFISGTKLTRGAIQAASTSLQPGRETLTGWLNPHQKIRGEVRIPLKNRTKFVPNILIELAPPSSIRECDRTNNTRSIEVTY